MAINPYEAPQSKKEKIPKAKIVLSKSERLWLVLYYIIMIVTVTGGAILDYMAKHK